SPPGPRISCELSSLEAKTEPIATSSPWSWACCEPPWAQDWSEETCGSTRCATGGAAMSKTIKMAATARAHKDRPFPPIGIKSRKTRKLSLGQAPQKIVSFQATARLSDWTGGRYSLLSQLQDAVHHGAFRPGQFVDHREVVGIRDHHAFGLHT